MTPAPTRRRVLREIGTALGLGLAGCLGTEGPGTTPTPTRPPASETETGSPSPSPSPETGSPPPSPGSPPPETDTPGGEPPVLWRRDLGAPVTEPPAVAGGTAYVGTDSGTVHAIATDDGRQRWSYETGRSIRGPPVVADGAVVAVSGTSELGSDHEVYALAADTGRKRWRFAPESWWLELLGVRDSTLYVATSDDAISTTGQTLYALGLGSGTERWSAGIGDPSGGVVTDDAVYVPSFRRLYAYGAAEGKRRFTRDLADYSYGTIAATDDTVFLVAAVDGTQGTLLALDARTGEGRWTFDDWTATSTTLRGGTLYAGGENVAAFDPATGGVRWQVEASGFVPDAPVREGTLYAGGSSVRAYATDDGTRRWSWSPDPDVQGSIPAAATSEAVYLDTYRESDPRYRYKFAVNAGTGETRWAFDGGAELTDLALAADRALVGDEDGTLYALGTG